MLRYRTGQVIAICAIVSTATFILGVWLTNAGTIFTAH